MKNSSTILSICILLIINAIFFNIIDIASIIDMYQIGDGYYNLPEFWQIIVAFGYVYIYVIFTVMILMAYLFVNLMTHILLVERFNDFFESLLPINYIIDFYNE